MSRNIALNLTKEEYFRIREQIKSGIADTDSSRAVRILLRWEADFRSQLAMKTQVSNTVKKRLPYLEKVGYIIHLRNSGMSSGKIAKRMNQLRTKSSTNRSWTPSAVKTLLRTYTEAQLPDNYNAEIWEKEAEERARKLTAQEIERLKKTITAKIGLDG